MPDAVAVVTLLAWLLVLLHLPRLAYNIAGLARRKQHLQNHGKDVRLSVVIAAKQEPIHLIKGLLVNLATQRCKPYEVILVWDWPRNDFEKVAENLWKFADRLGLRLRVVAKPWHGRGKSSVLNFAARLATGDALLVIDVDDRLCDADVLCKASELVRKHHAVQLGIVGIAPFHHLQRPTALAIHTGFRVMHEGRHRLGLSLLLVGSGLLIDAKLARRLLFDENATVEDVDLAVRLAELGIRPALLSDALCMSGAPGYRAFRRQQARWSYGVAWVLRKRARILARLGPRGLELAYTLANYILDPLTSIASALVAVVGSSPLPLYAYTLVMTTESMLATLHARTAPVAKRARSMATAGAFGIVLQPILLLHWLRGFSGAPGIFHVTPRRAGRGERPGRLETIYATLLALAGAIAWYRWGFLAAFPLVAPLLATLYLHIRLPALASGSPQHPQEPSRRKPSPRSGASRRPSPSLSRRPRHL
ncbi:glycosyl transferase family 2 [Pyrolobus fumarii 1A]|uniref:Glycosyl transferase family 2 n=1 Tax=Pyrolobus fumarii (strain DSM 11204 / 1A) TaxID=694429 RepID=G0EGS5_PYRF1|nr:glycosyltransferase family 2 protein [Pyrolobus fumarii]AEM39223.1 glycosyl transferase family 2 [Pyrolobus fumarii 1A]